MIKTAMTGLMIVSLLIAGCRTGRGYEWGHTGAGTFDEDPFNLTPFGSPATDGNGILYTLRCGTIDPDHVYGWARKTKSYYDAVYQSLLKDQKKLSKGYFKLSLLYPTAWQNMSPEEKQKAVHEIALEISQYLAFNDGLWHEISTWYGHRTFPLISDFESAFSWEDMYSDRLGTVIAAEALNRPGNFNTNVSLLTAQELEKRDLVDTDRAKSITGTMENIAYEDDPVAKKILWRSFDIGTGDGQIDPVIFPGFTDKEPIPLAAPTLNMSKKYNIQIRIVYSTSCPLYSTVKSKANITEPIVPSMHNEQILDVIKQDAMQRGFRVFD